MQPGTVGAQLVARAWVDTDFKELLLKDANAACAQMVSSADLVHSRKKERESRSYDIIILFRRDSFEESDF